MKIKLFICFNILGFLIKKLIKLLENVLVYGKIYCIVRIIKNEFFFEQILGMIQCRFLWYFFIWVLFVIKDEYLRYLVVEIFRGFLLLVNVIILVLDKVISLFGIFKVVNIDNDSLFNFK